jgi:hypothetical protein
MADKRQKLRKLKTEILGLLGTFQSDSEESEKEEQQEEVKPDFSLEKKKKPLTDKQREALKKGQETRLENARLRKEQADKVADEKKKAFEDKLVKKALSIKKKEIKQKMILEQISDDDEPVEEVIKAIEKPRVSSAGKPSKEIKVSPPLPAVVEPPKPVFNFFKV